MSHIVSEEYKNLFYAAREMAIEMGDTCISSIHFFLADCENKSIDSIYPFFFEDKNAYFKYKKECIRKDAIPIAEKTFLCP